MSVTLMKLLSEAWPKTINTILNNVLLLTSNRSWICFIRIYLFYQDLFVLSGFICSIRIFLFQIIVNFFFKVEKVLKGKVFIFESASRTQNIPICTLVKRDLTSRLV
jgi:hypothetical protein